MDLSGLVTGSAKKGFTIHPAVIEFKGQWYFFYHDGSNEINGQPGGTVGGVSAWNIFTQ